MADPVLTTLTQATEGLLYPSEYDEPLEPFIWEPAENTLIEVRRLSGHPRAQGLSVWSGQPHDARGRNVAEKLHACDHCDAPHGSKSPCVAGQSHENMAYINI
jgi:hypothetical protein